MTPPLHITRLAHKGDGETADGQFIPFTLPGEEVEIQHEDGGGYTLNIIKPSPHRVKPACKHFGTCGGCALQHMGKPAYLEWKREQVIIALEQRGLKNVPVEPVVEIAPGTRRRAVLAARRTRESIVLGFHERNGHFIADMQQCPVLHPDLLALVPKLRVALEPEIPERGQVEIGLTKAANGIDASFGIPGAKLNRDQRARLAILADRLKLSRLTVNEELILQTAPPTMLWGRAQVQLPPGAFLQATSEAEHVMQTHVAQAVSGAKKVADLFCGCGAFTLPLAADHAVSAFDSEAAAIDALNGAIKQMKGIKPCKAERRDLFRRPLLKHELNAFDAVVIDPPRAGAREQCEQLAQSDVARIAAVSCNPATFARDARILIDGGYTLTSVRPIDQFVWSPHIELTATFERK